MAGKFDPRRDDIIDLAYFFITLVLFFVFFCLIYVVLLLCWLTEKENNKKEYFRLRDIELGGRLMKPAGRIIQENLDGEQSGMDLLGS